MERSFKSYWFISFLLTLLLIPLPFSSFLPSHAYGQSTLSTLELAAEGIKVSYPEGWSVPPKRFANMVEIVNVAPDQLGSVEPTARVKITTETRRDHAEALQRL